MVWMKTLVTGSTGFISVLVGGVPTTEPAWAGAIGDLLVVTRWQTVQQRPPLTCTYVLDGVITIQRTMPTATKASHEAHTLTYCTPTKSLTDELYGRNLC